MSGGSTSNNALVAVAIGTTLAVGTLSSLGWYYYFTTRAKQQHASSLSLPDPRRLSNFSSQKFKPPFPQKIRDMLSKCRLAYLSTVDTEISTSHLSLMRFTYLHDEEDGEVVIMSTNKNTKKFDMLQRQNGVALLVHDFVADDGGGGMYSITLNGHCRILPNGSDSAERYRQAHLQHNPDYPQFIVGEEIVVLCVDVTSARICDIQDQVTKWNVQDAIEGNAINSNSR
jgi:general stress protein 26